MEIKETHKHFDLDVQIVPGAEAKNLEPHGDKSFALCSVLIACSAVCSVICKKD
jgi:hypothetical protein